MVWQVELEMEDGRETLEWRQGELKVQVELKYLSKESRVHLQNREKKSVQHGTYVEVLRLWVYLV